MERIRCVVFDVDGTLGRTNRLIFDSFNYIAQKYLHRTFTEPEIIALFGPPEEVCIENMLGKSNVEAASRDYYSFYSENHELLAPIFPSIREILDYLKKHGVILAVFTGKGARTTAITLEAFGILGYFDKIVTGSDVVRHKPSPEGMFMIMEAYNLKADEVLMVGDSIVDVKAARAAGVRSAAVIWDSLMKEEVVAMQPDRIFYSAGELLAWVRQTFPD